MTRAELIERLSSLFPQLTQKDVDLTVRVMLDKLSQTLANGGRAEIADLAASH